MILDSPISSGQSFELREHLISRSRAALAIQTNASGNGRDRIGPVPAGAVWHVRRSATMGATVAGGTVQLYANSASGDQLIDSLDTFPPTVWDSQSYATGEIQLVAGEYIVADVVAAGANAVVYVTFRYDVLEVTQAPIPGEKPPRSDTSGFPATPLQGDAAAGAQDRADESDRYDRDPMGPAEPAEPRRHALDGGIVTSFPADPSTPSGSDLF